MQSEPKRSNVEDRLLVYLSAEIRVRVTINKHFFSFFDFLWTELASGLSLQITLNFLALFKKSSLDLQKSSTYVLETHYLRNSSVLNPNFSILTYISVKKIQPHV